MYMYICMYAHALFKWISLLFEYYMLPNTPQSVLLKTYHVSTMSCTLALCTLRNPLYWKHNVKGCCCCCCCETHHIAVVYFLYRQITHDCTIFVLWTPLSFPRAWLSQGISVEKEVLLGDLTLETHLVVSGLKGNWLGNRY